MRRARATLAIVVALAVAGLPAGATVGRNACASSASPVAGPAKITGLRLPRAGSYLFCFSGNIEGEPETSRLARKTVTYADRLSPAITEEARGFRYRFTVRRVSGIPTLYLTELDVPRKDGGAARFVPRPALRVSGAHGSSCSTAMTPAGDSPPLDQLSLPNSVCLGIMQGSHESVDVNGHLVGAWRMSWDLSISGAHAFRMLGTVWFGETYGPLAIRDEIVADGGDRFISGNFESRLLRPDPCPCR